MGSRIRNNGLSDAGRSDSPLSGSPQPLPARLGAFTRTLRASLRLLILSISLAEVAARFFLLRLRLGPEPGPAARALWLHGACSTIVRRLGITVECRGPLPAEGLVCSNHLSYLDILVYAAVLPCVFVSKNEVRKWPAFGFFAGAGGSIFIDRQSRASTEIAAREMESRLAARVPVLLFPEGTSTDGSTVLRFHPSLLEPAVRRAAPMTAAAIRYRARGAEEPEICWYGDAAFLPHLLKTLGYPAITAQVQFCPDNTVYPDRKSAALALHAAVASMRCGTPRAVHRPPGF